MVTKDQRRQLFNLMDSTEGITEHASTFDRRDVLQFVSDWGGDRLSAAAVEDWPMTGSSPPRLSPSTPRPAILVAATSSAAATDAVLGARGHLGDDQLEMVRAITASTARIQAVYGPAGSGKTTAVEAAYRPGAGMGPR